MARFSGRVLAFEAEAVGILEAPSWIYTAPSQRVTVETDSLMVVNTLQRDRRYQLEVGNVLEACQSVLTEISEIRIAHVRKLANKTTHLMVRVPC